MALPVNKVVEDKVGSSFPLYKFFREKAQNVLEKQWWFDLHTRRTKLCSFRTKLLEVRNEKKQAMNDLKVIHLCSLSLF